MSSVQTRVMLIDVFSRVILVILANILQIVAIQDWGNPIHQPV
jgi:hypothetical protein